FAAQPSRDIRIIQGMVAALDPSVKERYPSPSGASAILIDATRKWDYPPLSLPKKQFMERAREIWEEEGLPSLSPSQPWYGYSLGDWTKEKEEEAEFALKGEHYMTGEKLARERSKS
ncbi:UbiD family decarboxylase, partial [Chloroflexota bacterium]